MRAGTCVAVRKLPYLVAGLIALAAVPRGEAAAQRRTAYFRIQVSPDCTIYGLLRQDELRLAPDPDQLAAVTPVKATKVDNTPRVPDYEWREYTFPEVAVPVPADRLPEGFSGMQATLHYRTGTSTRSSRGTRVRDISYVRGQFGLTRKDGAGTLWAYCWDPFVETGVAPEKAPAIQVPRIGRLTLQVSTETKKKLNPGIAVVAKSGEMGLSDILRAGKSVEAHLLVMGPDGGTVASEKGPLSKFGFT